MIGINTAEVYKLAGGMDGFAASLRSNWYMNDMTKYIGNELVDRFKDSADAWALAHGDAIDHMYEWNMAGTAAGRLFSVALGGSGKKRTVTFTYLPSKTFVPVPEVLLEPNPVTGAVVRQNVHVFKWKAPIMESGQTVTITPKGDNKLAFVDMATGGIRFATRSIQTPGKRVSGNFTTMWVAWWNNIAPSVFERMLGPELQQTNKMTFERTMKRETRQTFGLSATMMGRGGPAQDAKMKAKMMREMKRMIRRKAAG